MKFAGEITRLTSSQLEEAEEMLGRAFFDNPMSKYILPDDAERTRHLGWMFGTSTLYGHLFGEVHTTISEGRRHRGLARRPDTPPMIS